MDQFYLHNAALYQALVKRLSPAQDALSARGPTETASPDLIVTTRIRPLLDDEAAEGFPSAVFPRSVDTGVVDIHDLYNHPRGRPILKVSENLAVVTCSCTVDLTSIVMIISLTELQLRGRQSLQLADNHRGDFREPGIRFNLLCMERRHWNSLRLRPNRLRQNIYNQPASATRC